MPKKIKEPTVEQLSEMYVERKMSPLEMETELKISRFSIVTRLRRFGIPSRTPSNGTRNRYDKQPLLVGSKLQLALGSLLGDASISEIVKPTYNSWTLVFAHGLDQLDYLKHKRSVIGGCKIGPRPEGSNLGKQMFQFAYQNRPALTELARLVWRNGKKLVNNEWLENVTLEGVAYWFQDDGSTVLANPTTGYRVIRFYTNSFSENEISLLRVKLASLGLTTTVGRANYKNQPVICASRKIEVSQFLENIDPFVVPCLKYKTRICQPCQP